MARIRSIKPEFWTDEKVVALSPLARLLFIGMWNFVDDEGRAEYSPRRMKMQILPADDADISELLGEIRREKLIVVYTFENKECFQVSGFSKHQKVDKRTNSKFPPPPSPADFLRVPPTDQGMDQGGDQGKDHSETNVSGAEAPIAEVVPLDARTRLFRDGLTAVRAMTGKPDAACRKLLGQWLQTSKDDCSALLVIIDTAKDTRPADPVAWITKAISARQPSDDWRDDPLYRGVL